MLISLITALMLIALEQKKCKFKKWEIIWSLVPANWLFSGLSTCGAIFVSQNSLKRIVGFT